MSYNGISEGSRAEISSKVADTILAKQRAGQFKHITGEMIMREVLMESGFPVDHEDLQDVVVRTINLIIKRGK